MTNNITNLSVYRSHSDEGSIKGEQYLNVEGALNDNELLERIIPWLTLDSRVKDHNNLNDQLEGWSYFSEGEYYFVVRLISAGRHGRGNRISYFSHGRAFANKDLTNNEDPGLYLGISHAFDSLCREAQQQKPVSLPTINISNDFLTQIKSEKDTLINYIAFFYASLINKTPLVILVPITEFKPDSNLHKLISISRACLPQPLRIQCTIRIYAREGLDHFSKVDLLVVPDDSESTVKNIFPTATLLDQQGKIYKSPQLDPQSISQYKDYAEAVVNQLYNNETHPQDNDTIIFTAFSKKIAELFYKLNNNLSPDIKNTKILVDFSYRICELPFSSETNKEQYFQETIKGSLIEEYPAANWDVLLTDTDLAYFAKKKLLIFALEEIDSAQADGLKRLQNRIVLFLSKNTTNPPDIDHDTDFTGLTSTANRLEELLANGNPTFITRILSLLLADIDEKIDNKYPNLYAQKLSVTVDENFNAVSINDFLLQLQSIQNSTHAYQEIINCLASKAMSPDYKIKFKEICDSNFFEIQVDIFTKLISSFNKTPDFKNKFSILSISIPLKKPHGFKVSEQCGKDLQELIIHPDISNLKVVLSLLDLCPLQKTGYKEFWLTKLKESRFSKPNINNCLIFETKYQHLFPEYLLIGNNHLINQWIVAFPKELLKNQNFLNNISIEQQIEILAKNKLSIDDKTKLDFFIHTIDTNIKNNIHNNDFRLIELLIKQDIFEGWVKYSALTDEKKAISIYLLFLLPVMEIRFETWAYAIDNLESLDHKVVRTDFDSTHNINICWIDEFAQQQIEDLIIYIGDINILGRINKSWIARYKKKPDIAIYLENSSIEHSIINQYFTTNSWANLDWIQNISEKNNPLYDLAEYFNKGDGILFFQEIYNKTKIQNISEFFYRNREISIPDDFLDSMNKTIDILSSEPLKFKEIQVYLDFIFAINKKPISFILCYLCISLKDQYYDISKKNEIQEISEMIEKKIRLEHYANDTDFLRLLLSRVTD